MYPKAQACIALTIHTMTHEVRASQWDSRVPNPSPVQPEYKTSRVVARLPKPHIGHVSKSQYFSVPDQSCVVIVPRDRIDILASCLGENEAWHEKVMLMQWSVMSVCLCYLHIHLYPTSCRSIYLMCTSCLALILVLIS